MSKEVSLVLDVTSAHAYIFLLVNQEIKQFDTHENKNNLSDNLIEYIDSILHKNKYSLHDINKIYLVYGPGKFSAMRIAATVTKTLCLLNQAQLYIIDKFDYFSEPNSWVVIKSDGSKSFICHYTNNKKDAKPKLVEDSTINEYINTDKAVIYESNNKHQLINKLQSFKLVDYDFTLEYLKKPC